MTDQAINAAIAEACGYKADANPYREGKPCPVCDATGRRRYRRECIRCRGTGKLQVRVKRAPNYTNDLNAMHDAEKTLTQAQCGPYVEMTCSVQAYDAADDVMDEMIVKPCEHMWFHSTARQRAEAFLRTLGKWVD